MGKYKYTEEERKTQKAIELLTGSKFVEFTDEMMEAAKEGRLICPHGCEDDINQVEVATIWRRQSIRIEADGEHRPMLVVGGYYEVNDEDSGPRFYECHCRAHPVPTQAWGEYIGVAWMLPADIDEDWE
jgi:hypothetical protein